MSTLRSINQLALVTPHRDERGENPSPDLASDILDSSAAGEEVRTRELSHTAGGNHHFRQELAASMNTEKRHTPTPWDWPRETPAQVHKEIRLILFMAALSVKVKKLETATGHWLANYVVVSSGSS